MLAVFIVRSEATADASFAEMRARSKFGIAIAAMIRMIATTIKSSISEKPFCLVAHSLFLLAEFVCLPGCGRLKCNVGSKLGLRALLIGRKSANRFNCSEIQAARLRCVTAFAPQPKAEKLDGICHYSLPKNVESVGKATQCTGSSRTFGEWRSMRCSGNQPVIN